jgi:hypothetical protein
MPLTIGTARYTRRASGVLLTDGFNRADGPLGRADTGQAWEVRTGTAAIVSGQARFSAATLKSLAVLPCGVSDFALRVTLATNPASSGPAFCVAASGGSFLRLENSSATWALKSWNGASLSTLASVAGARANGDVLQIVKRGARIECWRNGALLFAHALTAANMALYGLNTWHGFGNEGDTTARWDTGLLEAA